MKLQHFRNSVDSVQAQIDNLKEDVFRIVTIEHLEATYYVIIFLDVSTMQIKAELTNMMFHPVNMHQAIDDDSMNSVIMDYTQIKSYLASWQKSENDVFPFQRDPELISAFGKYVKQLKVAEPSDSSAEDYGLPKYLGE